MTECKVKKKRTNCEKKKRKTTGVLNVGSGELQKGPSECAGQIKAFGNDCLIAPDLSLAR